MGRRLCFNEAEIVELSRMELNFVKRKKQIECSRISPTMSPLSSIKIYGHSLVRFDPAALFSGLQNCESSLKNAATFPEWFSAFSKLFLYWVPIGIGAKLMLAIKEILSHL
ncbi:unnamed protein product [Protopolystoma xenopodis]|uniref:Uncharacterized protein n=1 Tax=Protopolystoma xenopodis TaxID=117903 RepID=A0A3S5CQK8_9PLAT|nr:unnamed protein product [Protopolystoma xenopodis]